MARYQISPAHANVSAPSAICQRSVVTREIDPTRYTRAPLKVFFTGRSRHSILRATIMEIPDKYRKFWF